MPLLTGEPTSPRSTFGRRRSRSARRAVDRGATDASAPVQSHRPRARLAPSAATSRVLIAPASTATTTSSVRASVTRRPSTWCFGMPAAPAPRRFRGRRRAPRRARVRVPAPRCRARRARRQSGCSEQLAPELRARCRVPRGRHQSRPVRSSRPSDDVEVLHRLAGRALEQVVEHRRPARGGRAPRPPSSRCRRSSCARRA